MDSSAVNANVTIDDWSSLLQWSDQTQWQTPDPSSSSFSASTSPFLEGTYHETSVPNASVELDFQGPAVYVFGTSNSSFSVSVDSVATTFPALRSSSDAPYLLYGASNLTYANHSLVINNLGTETLLIDSMVITVQLAPAGATVTNTTVEDSDPQLVYSGNWTSNQSPLFSGGTSTYTNTASSVQLTFQGSALYMFGDKVNDHGPYTVSVDGGPETQLTGVSGCGGTFGKLCEKTSPSLMYFASNLGAGQHVVEVTNIPGVNGSYFDLDRFVITTPSVYAVRQPDNSSSSSMSPTSQTATGSTPSSTGTTSSSAASTPAASAKSSADRSVGLSTVLLFLLGVVWLRTLMRLR